jgi:type III secretory pathway component EscR
LSVRSPTFDTSSGESVLAHLRPGGGPSTLLRSSPSLPPTDVLPVVGPAASERGSRSLGNMDLNISLVSQLRDEALVLRDWDSTMRIYEVVSTAFVGYLTKFTNERELAFFMSAAHQLWPETMHHHIHDQNFFLLLPAHVTSEITKAFQIAFLLFLPFVIVDMVVSNVLLAMGAMMVPPMLVSLPLKILLFVAVDGWARLLQALVMSYV